MLNDRLWLKAAVPIPGDINGQFPKSAPERLLALAITDVATRINDGLILVVAKVAVHFGIQGLLDRQLGQLLQ